MMNRYLVMLFLFLGMRQTLNATIARFCLFHEPSTGAQVVALGDIHISGKAEKKQRKAVFNYLATKGGGYLIAEDMYALVREMGFPITKEMPRSFLWGIVAKAQRSAINAISIEFRSGTCAPKDYPDRSAKLLSTCDGAFQKGIPLSLRQRFDEMYKKALQIDDLAKEYAIRTITNEELTHFNDTVTAVEMDAINFVALTEVLQKTGSASTICVCMGDDHIVVLQEYFKELGFKEIEHVVTYPCQESIDTFDAEGHATNLQELLQRL